MKQNLIRALGALLLVLILLVVGGLVKCVGGLA